MSTLVVSPQIGARNLTATLSVVPAVQMRGTKWVFVALCGYLLAQSFTIPLIGIGPSWAVWPTLPDVAFGLLFITFLINYRSMGTATDASKKIFLILLAIIFGSIFSLLIFTAFNPDEGISTTGIFQAYRLIQFTCLFGIVARLPLAAYRVTVMSRVVTGTLIATCLGIVLTYFSVLSPAALTAHLPQGFAAAGPWEYYYRDVGQGLGTIGYNHGAVALQLIMLIGLRCHLNSTKNTLWNNLFLLMAIFACVLTESRSGLAAIIIFALVVWFKKPIHALISLMLTATLLLGVLTIATTMDPSSPLASTISRQLTLTDATATENLSGRDVIWEQHLAFLNEEPARWIAGAGFGSAGRSTDFQAGNNAHMLYLQIILELGILGLLLFGALGWKTLSALYINEPGWKPLFWVTIALLISSFTQETFYPVPAFGHFLGFYLCALAIGLRSKEYAEVGKSTLHEEGT